MQFFLLFLLFLRYDFDLFSVDFFFYKNSYLLLGFKIALLFIKDPFYNYVSCKAFFGVPRSKIWQEMHCLFTKLEYYLVTVTYSWLLGLHRYPTAMEFLSSTQAYDAYNTRSNVVTKSDRITNQLLSLKYCKYTCNIYLNMNKLFYSSRWWVWLDREFSGQLICQLDQYYLL